MDYNKKLYDFIFNQIKDTKYLYAKDVNALTLKDLAEKHYGFGKFTDADWQLAFEWATADVFGGGCEGETI
jgi:hypothetical protein